MDSDLIDLMMEEVLHLEEITYFDKLYYIFDRHRTSFLCWAKALKEGVIQKNNLLITIDKHCDFFIEDLKKERIELAKSLDINKIRNNIKENNKQDFIVLGMETGIIENIVIISPIINKSEFPNGLPENYKDSNGNILHGGIDNLLINKTNDKLIVLDYKTRGFPLKEDTHEHYQDQLNVYAYLLEKLGYRVEDFAYLLFYHPKEVLETGEVVFNTDLKKMKISAEDAERLFNKAIKMLNVDCPKETCVWCENV